MKVLVMEGGQHIHADAVQRDCPNLEIISTRNEAEALNVCADAEVLVALAHEINDDLVSRMAKLRYICALTSGTDHLAHLKTLPKDVLITSGRGIHGPQMSELAFLYMISLSRRFPRMQANQRAHVWERWPQQILLGKTAVIVGIGPIAEDLATRCKAFGLTTIGISDARKEAVGFDQLLPRARITEACGRADFLVILVPLTDQTRGMINATVLSALKPTSIVINLARGPIIDEGALVEALQSGKIGGAGLDVFENEPLPSASPLWDMPNVIITPRIGGMSDEYPRQVLPVVVHNLSAFARGARDEMINVVR